MDKILTIIIPTYNMEKYLRHCLDSLIVPNMDKVEVLVVNDGSKDSSSAIAHEYQDKYPQTFRVIDKENGNYGSCINRGLKEATGKYIRILDADDWFDKSVFSNLIDALPCIDVEVVYTPFVTIFKDKKVITKQSEIQYGVEVSLRDKTLSKDFFAMHSLTYRTAFLKRISYRQEEKISYTDTEYVFYPLCHATSIYCYNEPLYQYYVGREGQSMSLKVMAKNFFHFDKVLNNLLSYTLKGTLPTSKKLCEYYYIVLFRYMLDIHVFMSWNDEAQEKELRKVANVIIERGTKFQGLINGINLKGFHYGKWWLNNTSVDRMKLYLFSNLKKFQLKYAKG